MLIKNYLSAKKHTSEYNVVRVESIDIQVGGGASGAQVDRLSGGVTTSESRTVGVNKLCLRH